MAKVLTATGLSLGLIMVASLAFSSSADASREAVQCVTTLLGDVASCR